MGGIELADRCGHFAVPGDSVEMMSGMEKGRAGVEIGAALGICVLFLL